MIKTGIKIEGDSRDAQRAFSRLKDDVRDTQRAISGFAREAASVSFGVLGAGTLEEGLTAAYDAAREALESYIERNQEAAQVVEGTRLVLRDMSDTFFEAALGGGNLEAILGTIQEAAQALTGVFGDNRDAIRSAVMDGWATLIETIPTAIAVFNGFRAVVDGVRLVFIQFRMAIRVGITALLDMGRAVQQGLLSVLRDLSEGVSNIINDMGSLAQVVDDRLGTNLSAPFDRASARLSDFAGGLDDSIDRLATIGRQNRAMIQQEVVESQQASADIIRGIEERENARVNLANTIADFVDRLRSGEVGEQALRSATEGTTSAMEEQAVTLADLTGLIDEYGQRTLDYFAAYKDRAGERARATQEMLAFEMDAYTTHQDKLVELAQIRADAEAGAQMKISDAIMRTTDAYDRWASVSVESFELAIAGQQSFAEAARASIGDVVAGLSEEIRARAIAAGATGNFGAAAALGAASVAIGAIAASLGASQGGGGGGGGASAEPTQVINTSVQVVAGPAGITQDQVRELSNAVQSGVDRGLIRLN